MDGSDYMIWIEADYPRIHYITSDNQHELLNEAIAKAGAELDTTGLNRFAVIYAEEVTYEGALHPHAAGNAWIMGETFGGTFSHIGTHCHEFGHTIGMVDKYLPFCDEIYPGIGRWGLMSYGNDNGPLFKGESPAHPNALTKIGMGWITPTPILSNENIQIEQSEQYPLAYKISLYENYPDVDDEYFIIVNRQPYGFDQYLLNGPGGIPGFEGGLFIWHRITPFLEKLEQADGLFDLELGNSYGDEGDPFPGSTSNDELTALSAPSSNGYSELPVCSNLTGTQDNATGVAISDISQDPSGTISFNIRINEWLGKIMKNQTWSSNIDLSGDILIHGSNDTIIEFDGQAFDTTISFNPIVLEVLAGTNIYASTTDAQNLGSSVSRVEILVDGVLNVLGSEINPVIFTSASASPTRFDWQGIQFNPINPDSLDTNSVISNSVIEYAYIGVGCKDADPLIEYNTIQECSYGARMTTNANPILKYNTFTNNSSMSLYSNNSFNCSEIEHLQYNIFENTRNGLWLINSSPIMLGNSIRSNTSKGIYFSGSSPYLYQNEFIDNSGIGLYCKNGSSPQATFNPNTQWGGYNTISGNSGDGVYARSSSYPNLGIIEFDDGPAGGGYNIIMNNGGYEVKNNNASGYIHALNNWWGSPSGPGRYDLYGDVVYDPFLESPPTGRLITSSTQTLTETSLNFLSKTVTISDSIDYYISIGIYLFSISQYQVAANIFERIIENSPDAPGINCAVDYFVKSCRGYLSVMQTLGSVHSLAGRLHGHEVRYFLLSKTIFLLENAGRYQPAVNRATYLLQNFQDDEDMFINILFQRGSIYKYKLDNYSNAIQDFSYIIENYPESDLAVASEFELSDFNLNLIKRPGKSYSSCTPVKFKIHPNYPNPFNPATTIKYDLPEDAHVEIVIYNMLGEVVNKLQNENQTAGYHFVVWNGTDNSGQRVSSGVYLIVIESEKVRQLEKCLIIK